MKKIIIPILILMMFIPFYVKADNCDSNKVKITSISIENKSDSVEELDKASANGNNVNLNLSMSEVGDHIKYKIVIKNDSSEDYMFDKSSLNMNSKYIDYSLEFDDNSNIIKSNSSKDVHLKVEYKNEVPIETFESGKYNDNKTVMFNIATNDEITNPKTINQSFIIILLIVLIVCTLMCVVVRKKKYTSIMILIISIVFIIPISVYALCKSNIKVESNVEIKDTSFTGTLYRYNSIHLKHGTNISGYLLKSPNIYRKTIYNSKDECYANLEQGEECEKIKDSIFNYDGFYRDPEVEAADKHVYLRHEVVNNIIKNTYICYLDDLGDYCIQGGDNGNSFSLNEQVIRNFNQFNSYCYMSVQDDRIGCSGSYGMEMFAHMNGAISAYYFFGMGCDVTSDSISWCNN